MNQLLLILVVFCKYSMSIEVGAAFKRFQIVPDILNVAPKQILNVTYPNGVFVKLGNKLSPSQVEYKPQVTWAAEKDAFYSLVMVDADFPSRQMSKSVFGQMAKVVNFQYREVFLWIVVDIPGSSVDDGQVLVDYMGVAPLQFTGYHRYILLVFKQKYGKIQNLEPYNDRRSINSGPTTSVMGFAQKYNLGVPQFGNFFKAQNGEYNDRFLSDVIG